ncbi:MAG TPA: cytochrome P450 [Tepidisphaeraceae bacterium]|jgi:hypothetical protein|nr:cytochrome P450 [Tepidisphaeraceae bacterium]
MTQSTAQRPSAVNFNPLLPAFRDNPHPYFHALRQNDPVHWSSVFQVWALTRYADCVAALQDKRLSSNARRWIKYDAYYLRGSAGEAPADIFGNWMLQLDPPDHTRLRSLVNKAFTPRVAEAMRGQIQSLVDELLAPAAQRGAMDVVADLAYPLPVLVMCDMLGMDRADYPRIKIWSENMLPWFGGVMSREQLRQVNEAVGEFREYFMAIIARRSPAKNLMTDLIDARDGENKLSTDELISTAILLTVAGHMTTVQLLSNGLLALLRHPDQLARLRREPGLIVGAVEEMLRYEAPLQMLTRTATEDFDLFGAKVLKGQMVMISLTAASRDPARFPEPDRFDIARPDNRHLAFGYGAHYCAGAPLARLEAQLAIQSMLSRFESIELGVETIEREPSMLLRGIKALPLRLRNERASVGSV